MLIYKTSEIYIYIKYILIFNVTATRIKYKFFGLKNGPFVGRKKKKIYRRTLYYDNTMTDDNNYTHTNTT